MRKSVAKQRKIHTVFKARVSGFRRCAIGVLGVLGAVALRPYTALACSVCGGSAMGTDPGTGFNTSILFLLSMPYVVVGVIAGWLIYSHWRKSGDRQGSKGRMKLLLGRSRRNMA